MERGWLTDAVDSEAEAPVAKTEPTEQDSETTQMELSFPVEDWTVPQLKNLLHTLYSNQHILRRMMQSDALYIDRQLVERLKDCLLYTSKGLSYSALRSMVNLKSKKYSDLTTEQLLTLRNRILFALEADVKYPMGCFS